MKDPQRMLTTGEVAQYCGVSYHTAIRWTKRGELKAFQLPGRGDRRIKVEDFLIFLKEKNLPIPKDLQTDTRKALIVDDEITTAKSIERVLKQEGFTTKIASNGFQAGSFAEAFKPDIMTLDINMLGFNGHQVLQILKSNETSKNLSSIKILVISALSREELEQTLREGADDYLEKPFQNKALATKVNRLIKKGELKDG